MEASEVERGVYDVAAGEHRGLTADSLAMTITTTMTVIFAGSHFFGGLPRLRFVRSLNGVEERLSGRSLLRLEDTVVFGE
jgi:hypothetical protein